MEKNQLKVEQAKWVTDYYRRVQELIDHIFKRKHVENDDPNIKDKIFLRDHKESTAKTLSGIKISSPETALNILESLRAVLLKKKVDLEDDRRNQEHNKSVAASYMDSSSNTSQNVSAASFISATTNATKEDKESDFAEQFCDFDKLQKKWGKNNVD
jgi:hypothetical protein